MTAFKVSGPGLLATILPERGGRISSLIDDSGLEWLTQPAGKLGEPPAVGSSFTNGDMAGWDECAPSINACDINGVTIPDHGELWTSEFDENPPSVSATGTTLGYQFERRISPTGDGLRFDYTASSLGDDIPFLWAAHPQFVAPEGTRVRIDGVSDVVEVTSASAVRVAWTDSLAAIDTLSVHTSRKVYLDPENPRFEASLVRPDGRALRLRWSTECPYLGLWFDRRQYSREPVIAIEPSTGHGDSLADANDTGRVAVIRPGIPLRWWVEVAAVTPDRPSHDKFAFEGRGSQRSTTSSLRPIAVTVLETRVP